MLRRQDGCDLSSYGDKFGLLVVKEYPEFFPQYSTQHMGSPLSSRSDLQQLKPPLTKLVRRSSSIISSKPAPGGNKKAIFSWGQEVLASSLGGSEKDAAILATGSETAATTDVVSTSVTLYATATISVPTAATFAPVIGVSAASIALAIYETGTRTSRFLKAQARSSNGSKGQTRLLVRTFFYTYNGTPLLERSSNHHWIQNRCWWNRNSPKIRSFLVYKWIGPARRCLSRGGYRLYIHFIFI